MTNQTYLQYDAQLNRCRELFVKKTYDYGTSWRVMRISSLIDQIFIKAQRLRSIEEQGQQKISDPIQGEYIGMVNYSIIAMVQMQLGESFEEDLDYEKLFHLYDEKATNARELMKAKNHDYGEAWREMLISSLTDLILAKLLRMREIIKNKGKTLVSEGMEANLLDIINYSLFALIRLEEGK